MILDKIKIFLGWGLAILAAVAYAIAAIGKSKAEKKLSDQNAATQEAELEVLNAQATGLSDLAQYQADRRVEEDESIKFGERNHFTNGGMGYKDQNRERRTKR